MKKNVCWFLAVMLFCAVAYGGCGGGGSSLAGYDYETQSQDVTPTPTPTPTDPVTPTPTDPVTPTPQSQDVTPTPTPQPQSQDVTPTPTPQPQSQDVTPTPTPTNPDTQGSKHDFSVLAGTWTASNGTGTVTGDGLSGTASLSPRHSNTISFSNVNVSGNTATIDGTSQIYWDAYQGGTLLLPDWEDEFGGGRMEFSGLEFHNTSGNTWVMEHTNKYDKITRTTITLTSSTTAAVERFEDRDVLITGSYTLTKTADAPANTDTTAYSLEGTWRIESGTLTYPDGTTAEYVSNSATADPFEIGLYDLGDDSYVLSLWAESGGFEKEGSPYCKASFGASNQLVRIVWGTSEDWNDPAFSGYSTANSTYKRVDTNTYTAEFSAVIHDVETASFQLTNASTVHYTQTGPCLDTGDRDMSVTVDLVLTRVN